MNKKMEGVKFKTRLIDIGIILSSEVIIGNHLIQKISKKKLILTLLLKSQSGS